jgi:PadR family transcriptional regulator PadR
MKDSHRTILAALVQGPAYGREISKRVEASTNGLYTLGQATLYPALRELEEQQGMLESWEEQVPGIRGGRPRRYYKLNAKGHRAARAERIAASGLWGLKLAEEP